MTSPGSDKAPEGPWVATNDHTEAHAALHAPEGDAPQGDAPETDAVPPPATFQHARGRHGVVGPFGGRQLAVGALVVVTVAVALVVLTMPIASTNGISPRDPRPTAYVIGAAVEGLRPGDLAPDLAVQRSDGSTFVLADLRGQPIHLSDFRGKGVWLNFFATWCPPCQAETPVLRDTYGAYEDKGLELIGISVQESSASDVAAYADRYSLGYTIGFDGSGDIFNRYRVYALPTQVFVDPNGVIRAVVQGPLDPTTAAMYVEQIVPAAGSALAATAPPGGSASLAPTAPPGATPTMATP